MQNFTQDVNDIIKKHKTKRLYAITAFVLSLAVVFMVVSSLIRPAISATKLGNSDTLDDTEMLVGSNFKNTYGITTPQNAVEKANELYALGIASQFSVFLQNNFVTSEADTEGRLACGGNLDVTGYVETGGNNAQSGDGYRIGYGHYVDSNNSVDLLSSQYGGSFAHAIVGGKASKYLATNTNNEKWRRFMIESDDDEHLDRSWNYDNYYKWAFFTKTSDVLNFGSAFTLLKERSNMISVNAKNAGTTVKLYDSSGNEITDLSSSSLVNKVVFDGNDLNQTADSIMFNITSEQMSKISQTTGNIYFEFKNIPDLSNAISGSEVDSSGNTQQVNWNYSYIIVNVEGDNISLPNANFHTSVNDTEIGKGDGGNNPNNKFGCSTILYNCSTASNVTLGIDFQGSILAPNADVGDHGSISGGASGHLSGALVAKSFNGCMEFGYRPYTGPIEVLGTTTNYEISVAKVDGNSTPLSGATIQLYQISEGTETLYNEYVTDGTTKTLNVVPGKYKLVESAAPNGYNKSNDTYYFEVSEGDKQTATVTIGESAESITQTIETELWSGSLELNSEWNNSLTINAISSAKTGDKIRVHLSSYSNDTKVQICQNDSSWSSITGFDAISIDSNGNADFTITDANLDIVKNSGIRVKGGTTGTVDKITIISTSTTTGTTPANVDISYVPSVTITTYSDSGFTTQSGSQTFITTDLSQTSYDIDGTRYKGNELPSTVEVVADNSDSSKKFVIKDGIPLTPIVNLSDFKFVNTAIPKGANITLQKADKDNTSTELSGAQVSLYANGGTKIGTYTLGSVTLPDSNSDTSYFDNNKLKPGGYYLVEESVPDGYLDNVKGKQLKFTVGEDGAVAIPSDENSSWLKLENADSQYTIKIFNEQGGNIDIGKEWVNSSGESITPPDNAEITVKLYRTTDASIQNSAVNKASAARLFSVSRAASSTGDDSWFTIENILSNYQFFVQDDLTALGHTVGGIAVGGNATLGSWGDGQISPSVIGGKYTAGSTNFGAYFDCLTDEQKSKTSNIVYYGSSDSTNLSSNFIIKTNVIDFDSALTNISSQSKNISDTGFKIETGQSYISESTEWYGTTYNINLSELNGKKNIVIPYSVYLGADAINFKGVDLAEFMSGGYTISITDVNDNDINFTNFNNESGKKIIINGESLNMQNLSSTQRPIKHGIELDLSGTNLIYNFPDATGNITVRHLVGHIVAPKANVIIDGAAYEGGVIAKSANKSESNPESHFYSYYPFDEINFFSYSSTGDDPSSQPDESSSSSSDDSSSTSSGTDSSSSSSSSSSADSSSGTESGGGEITGEFVKDITLNNDNDWKQTVSGLPIQDESGNKYYYYVEETPTIDGYTPTYSGPVTLTKGGTAKITITNTQNAYTLPATGGIGRYVFYIAGGMLACTSAAILVIQRRKKRLN